jgi:hypothetical protein
MATRPDGQALSALERDHLRFDMKIRDLLRSPSSEADWASELSILTAELSHHLEVESTLLLAPLEHEGRAGQRAADMLRKDSSRIFGDLADLRAPNAPDASKLLLLSYDVSAHGARTDDVLHDLEGAASLPLRHPIASEAVSVLSGMFVGAAVAGPIGAAGGALAGGLAAGVALVAAHNANVAQREHDEQLDRDIGVVGGHIGEASPNAPPVRIGAFSAAASGAGGGGRDDDDDAAGPIPEPTSRR